MTIATQDVIAYESNQAKSDTNACGNGVAPMNVGCQNIDSQIQGDENSVALTAQQTFPSVTQSRTCEECFTAFLTADEIANLEFALFFESRSDISSIRELCMF